jgi:hypothetical protein
MIAVSGAANAVVIDFEELAVSGAVGDVANGYTTQGFTFTSTLSVPEWQGEAFAVWGSSSIFYAGSTALFNNFDAEKTTMTMGGGAFNATSIDLTSLFLDSGSSINFTGTRANNTTVTNILTITDPVAFQTFNFTGMTNIVKLSWDQFDPYHQFDNINVSAVPEPASLAALALGGLALIRRKRATR